MKTEYKGFTIQHGVENSSDRFFIADGVKVDSWNFSFDGYATLGNAKGAITKLLKANNAQHRDDLKLTKPASVVQEAVAEATAKGQDPYLAGIAARWPSKAEPESDPAADKRQKTQLDNVAAHMADKINKQDKAKPATITKADHASVPVAAKPAQASRNKREGRYVGKVWGSFHVRAGVHRVSELYAVPSLDSALQIQEFKSVTF